MPRALQGDRSARRADARGVGGAGLLVSNTVKGAVRLQFSVESADVLFPRLFAAQIEA
jgi:hypothetical protein